MASRLDVRRPDRGRRGGPGRALCQDGSDPDGSTDVRCWSGAVGRSSPLPHAGIRAHPRGARSDSEAGRHDYTFVTDGIWGGANIVRQYLKAGLLDEMQIHLVPVLLGGGVRLFEDLGLGQIDLERTRTIETPKATHLRFIITKPAR